MTTLLAGLLAFHLGQLAPDDYLRRAWALEKSLAAGRFAEAERGYLELADFPRADGPWLLDELPLAVNAAAQQKSHCAALRKRLSPENPQHRHLALLLDAAQGNLSAARAALLRHLDAQIGDGGTPPYELNSTLSLAAFLDWAAGDAPAFARHVDHWMATRARVPAPSPFDGAMTTALFAVDERRKGKLSSSLAAWGRSVALFERSGASRHPFLALVLDAQADALEADGQRDLAAGSRARAAQIRALGGCR